MKIRCVRLLAGALAALAMFAINSQLSSALAQGTAFTYQGELQSIGTVASGTYNLQFSLYTSASGGVAVAGPVTTNGVAISNGLFTVTIDFGASVWNGETNWLQIGVETNGAGTFTALTPRQQLTPSPYAIYAEGANAVGLSGTVPNGDLGGTYGNVVDFSNPGNIFVGNGAGLVGVNASLLDGLASSNFWQTTGNGGTTAGPDFVGTTDDQPLYLDSFGYPGLRLQYVARSSYPIVFFQYAMNTVGGYWGNTISNNVIGGTIAGGGDQTSRLVIGGGGVNYYPNIVSGDFGAVGGGYANTAGGEGTVPGGYENFATGIGSFAAGSYAQTTNNGSFIWGDGSTTFNSYGARCFDVLASGGAHFITGTAGVNVDQLNLNASSDGLAHRTSVAGFNLGPGGSGPFLWGYDGGGLGTVFPDEVSLIWDYFGDVWISNNCSVATLTIRGGADLAEPFPMSAQSAMQPGCVVVIDDQHPGQLKLSDQPYDTRVAGVVSGANGIHPGIQMQQQGLLEGGKNVALTGRVYVRVDASYGAVHPGDFLTTSATPGCAMRVTDHARAQGAILGKAMTALDQGTGMVLVLVTLQ